MTKPHLLSTTTSGSRRSIIGILMVTLMASSCGGTAEPAESSSDLVAAPSQATTSQTETATNVVLGRSILDSSGFQTAGSWYILPYATDVVLGHLEARTEEEMGFRQLTGTQPEVWQLVVDRGILGTFGAGDTVLLAHGPLYESADRSASRDSWSPGTEAIFFLGSVVLGPGVVSPTVYAPVFGDRAIIWDTNAKELGVTLDELASILPAGESLLGEYFRASSSEPADHVNAANTRLAVVAKPLAIIDEGSLLGWDYADVQFEVQRPIFEPQGLATSGLAGPELLIPKSRVVVRLSRARAEGLTATSDEVVLKLDRQWFQNSDGTWVWLAVGGDAGILPVTQESAVSGKIQSDLNGRDIEILALRGLVDDQLESLVKEFGTLPSPALTPKRPPAPVNPIATEPPPSFLTIDDLYTPIVVYKSGFEVEFDRWFWALLDGTGTVTVRDGDMVMVEGAISGPDALVRNVDGVFEVLDSKGNVLVALSSEDLDHAIDSAVEEIRDSRS